MREVRALGVQSPPPQSLGDTFPQGKARTVYVFALFITENTLILIGFKDIPNTQRLPSPGGRWHAVGVTDEGHPATFCSAPSDYFS